MIGEEIKTVVKEKYGRAAIRVKSGGSSCCGAAAASNVCCDPITSNLYDSSHAGQIPEEALLASIRMRQSDSADAAKPWRSSLKNPVVTVARSASNTFAGIGSLDVVPFITAQLVGFAATFLFRWLVGEASQVEQSGAAFQDSAMDSTSCPSA